MIEPEGMCFNDSIPPPTPGIGFVAFGPYFEKKIIEGVIVLKLEYLDDLRSICRQTPTLDREKNVRVCLHLSCTTMQ